MSPHNAQFDLPSYASLLADGARSDQHAPICTCFSRARGVYRYKIGLRMLLGHSWLLRMRFEAHTIAEVAEQGPKNTTPAEKKKFWSLIAKNARSRHTHLPDRPQLLQNLPNTAQTASSQR